MWSIIYLFINHDLSMKIKVLCNIKAADCELKPGRHELPLVYTGRISVFTFFHCFFKEFAVVHLCPPGGVSDIYCLTLV